ncbi:MAG: hypothetical protein ACYCPT_13845, partial [Acidimicrobiales bacterium]
MAEALENAILSCDIEYTYELLTKQFSQLDISNAVSRIDYPQNISIMMGELCARRNHKLLEFYCKLFPDSITKFVVSKAIFSHSIICVMILHKYNSRVFKFTTDHQFSHICYLSINDFDIYKFIINNSIIEADEKTTKLLNTNILQREIVINGGSAWKKLADAVTTGDIGHIRFIFERYEINDQDKLQLNRLNLNLNRIMTAICNTDDVELLSFILNVFDNAVDIDMALYDAFSYNSYKSLYFLLRFKCIDIDKIIKYDLFHIYAISQECGEELFHACQKNNREKLIDQVLFNNNRNPLIRIRY